MADLLGELFSIESDFSIDTITQNRGLKLLLEDRESVVLVAQNKNCIIGMVSVQPLVSTAMGGRVGLIEDMIVTSEHRGRGVGKLLLGSLIDESKALGHLRLALGIDLRNQQALAFYRTFGFESSHMGLMYRI